MLDSKENNNKSQQVVKVGRPEIVIDSELCAKAESLAAQGLTMSQIATVLGMGEATFYEKKAQYSEFSESIKRGKDKGIATITSSLFKKASIGIHSPTTIKSPFSSELRSVNSISVIIPIF